MRSSTLKTVGSRLTLLSIAFFLALFVPTWIARNELNAQTSISTSINVAGRQRMLTQKIAKSAQTAHDEGRESAAAADLLAASDLFTRTLGHLADGNSNLGIAPLHTEAEHRVHREIDELWRPMLAAVGTLLDPDAAPEAKGAAVATVLAGEGALLKKSDELVQELASESRSSVAAVTRMLSVILVLSLGYLVASWFVVRHGVLLPLKRAVDELSETTTKVLADATSVRDHNRSLASSVTESAASLEETAASLEEMSGITQSNAANTLQASGIASRTRTSSSEGAALVQSLEQSMQGICASSTEMRNIVKSIESIAFQTNLLALNAAVEAARAGEHGKGFAVVADEVRNLAQRAAEATRSTASLIEESHQRTMAGLENTTRVSDSLTEIQANAEQVEALVLEISSASAEMAEGIGQINTAVTQLDRSTQDNSISANESVRAADEILQRTGGIARVKDALAALIWGEASAGGRVSDGRKQRPGARRRAGQPGTDPQAPLPAGAAGPGEALESFLPLGGDDFEEF